MSCREEHLFRDLVQADAPWEVVPQQATPVLVAAALPGRMRPAKIRAQASGRLRPPEACHFRTAIKRQRLSQVWWYLTQTRNKPAPEAAAVLLWALASSRERLLRSLQLSSAAWPLEAQTRSASQSQSGFCLQQAAAAGLYRYARASGLASAAPALPPATSVGAAQMTAAGIARQCGRRDPAGRWSPTDAHALILRIVQPQTARHPFGRPDRSGACGGHGAAPGKWCCGGGPGQAAIVRQLMPMATNTSVPMRSARIRWLRDMAGSCRLLGAWHCQLDQNPALSLLPFSHPDRVVHWQ